MASLPPSQILSRQRTNASSYVQPFVDIAESDSQEQRFNISREPSSASDSYASPLERVRARAEEHIDSSGIVTVHDERHEVSRERENEQEPAALQLKPSRSSSTDRSAEGGEPRKCWICYFDETEDTPFSSEWRSPCPCALTAHESCLLDWLADLESPMNRRSGRQKFFCPQCRSPIVVARPRSLIASLMRHIEWVAGRLVIPGVVFTLAGTVWAGCCAHGAYSLYVVFGPEEAENILASGRDLAWNARLNLGLPLIPIVLVLSRTKYAENMLPAIPVFFFTSQNPSLPEFDGDLWPPGPALIFAALPYARCIYTMIYEKLFGDLERKWIAEVQPRAGEEEAEREQRNRMADAGGGDNEDVIMALGFDVQINVEERTDGAQEPAPPENQGPGNNADQGLGRRHEQLISANDIIDSVLGALFFPTVSASMGGALKLVLPSRLTTSKGLLSTRWGRSVLGGCLFVFLKDALTLYCRWKIAKSHRHRRVLNYDKKLKKIVDD